jgi:hypothetical protein
MPADAEARVGVAGPVVEQLGRLADGDEPIRLRVAGNLRRCGATVRTVRTVRSTIGSGRSASRFTQAKASPNVLPGLLLTPVVVADIA